MLDIKWIINNPAEADKAFKKRGLKPIADKLIKMSKFRSEAFVKLENLLKQINELKNNKTKIDGQIINDVLTVNGVRFSFEDGSWGLIRASSNKPSLVVVTESPTSDNRKKEIFYFIDNLLQKTGKIGEYDQKI